MARDKIEESLRTKMTSIKVHLFFLTFHLIVLEDNKMLKGFVVCALTFEGENGSIARCTERC